MCLCMKNVFQWQHREHHPVCVRAVKMSIMSINLLHTNTEGQKHLGTSTNGVMTMKW